MYPAMGTLNGDFSSCLKEQFGFRVFFFIFHICCRLSFHCFSSFSSNSCCQSGDTCQRHIKRFMC